MKDAREQIRGMRKKRRRGRIYLVLIVAFIVTALSVQMVRLWKKKEAYAAQETELQKEKQDLVDQQEELKEYEDYTKTDQYNEDQARQKLGMVHDNETIYREKK